MFSILESSSTLPLFLFTSLIGQVLTQDKAIIGECEITLPAKKNDWWTNNVEDEDFANGKMHLHAKTPDLAAISSKERLLNRDFTVEFDYQVNSEETKQQHNGFFVGYQYPSRKDFWQPPLYYWKVLLNDARLITYTLNNQNYNLHLVSSELLAADRWYRLHLHNTSTTLTVEVLDVENGQTIDSKTVSHPLGIDTPTPIDFVADAELTEIQRPTPAPLNTVLNQYNLRTHGVDWEIAVSGYLKNIKLTHTSDGTEQTSKTDINEETLLDNGIFMVSQSIGQSLKVSVHDSLSQKEEKKKILFVLPKSPAHIASTAGEVAGLWHIVNTQVDCKKKHFTSNLAE
ncbi:TPA: hypothetical protein EYN09_09430 [Candidatus Poribacteria bacterium]|nr:hypothetical protein [Candidatus Poribacteria bacterium]